MFRIGWIDGRYYLPLLCAVVVLLSLAYSFGYRIRPAVDARAYDTIAMNMLAGNGFREDLSVPLDRDWAILRAGPGYELFLAGLYWLFGHRYEPVWIAQALVRGVSTLLVYRLGREVFPIDGRRIGLVAAAIFGLSPDLVEISAMLMTETLYLLLTVLVAWLFLRRYNRCDGRGGDAVLGAAMGAAILTRPVIGLFLLPILYLYVARRQLLGAAVLLGCLAIVMLPWNIYTYQTYGQLIPTTLIGELNLWTGNMPGSIGGQATASEIPPTVYVRDYGMLGFKQQAVREFLAFALGQPLAFAQLSLVRAVRFFSLARPMGFWFYQTGLPQALFVASSALYIAFLFLTGFAGAALLARDPRPAARSLLLLLVLTPLPLLVTVVQSRYRFQIYPLLALTAACFLVWAFRARWASRRYWLPVGAALGLVTLVDLAASFRTVVERLGRFV